MIDVSSTIAAKSDQLNADDLIGRTITITVTKVTLLSEEQPVAIHYEGDEGKPYKPGKSMRRLLVGAWKGDGNQYVGRRMTLFRDEKVQFGGLEVGGIRISHMSDLPSGDRPFTMALTAKRGNKRAYTVQPLPAERGKTADAPPVDVPAVLAAGRVAAERGSEALQSWWKALSGPEQKAAKPTLDAELKATAAAVDLAAASDATGDDPPADLAGLNMTTGADLLKQQQAAASQDAGAGQGDKPEDLLEFYASTGRYIEAVTTKADLDALWAEWQRDGHTDRLEKAHPPEFRSLCQAMNRRGDELVADEAKAAGR